MSVIHDRPLTEKELRDETERINSMSRESMASLWRFAKAGHPYFQRGNPLQALFKARFDSLGGFSPAVSKSIGLEAPSA